MNFFILSLMCELLYAVGMVILTMVLTLLEKFGTVMLEPFNFSTEMFSTMFSSQFLNSVENIMIAAGVSVSLVILIFGLTKVFTGRLSDDVPNPFSLIGRFVLAIFGAVWSIPVMVKYLFPFSQEFFNRMLKISSIKPSESLAQSFIDMASNKETFGVGFVKTAIDGFTGIGLLKELIFLIILLIFIISAVVNILKLVVENAERYFTINVLVLSAPLAMSTVASEKTMQVFKNWFLSLISNIITIIFNLFGFKLVMLAFNNCFKEITEANFQAGKYDQIIIALIALVAISKMAQKFDQFVSMIVFRINPIQNRSLLMSALGTIGTLDKIGSSIMGNNSPLGKLAHGVAGSMKKSLDSSPLARFVQNKSGKSGAGGVEDGTQAYDNKLNKDGALTQTLNGDVSTGLKNDLGLPQDSKATLHSSSSLDPGGNTRVGVGDMIDAIQEQNIADPNGNKAVTPEQAQSVMNAVSGQLKDGNKIVGYDTDKREFIVGKQSKADIANGYKTIGEDAPAMANLMNGNANVESISLSGSDNDAYDKLKSYRDAGYYYANRGDGHFDVYLDKTDSNTISEFNVANPSSSNNTKYTPKSGLTSDIISNNDKGKS